MTIWLQNWKVFVAGAIALVALGWAIVLEVRLRRLMRGKTGKDLEEVMMEIIRELEKLNVSREKTDKYLAEVEARLQKSVAGAKMVRFNPFKDLGGNQSFAVALLDEGGNGAVISSLYSRERNNVYAKPVKNYQSEIELTNEEREAIKQFKNQ